MSILLALDETVEAQKKIRTLCEAIERITVDAEVKETLIDSCHTIQDHILGAVKSLEKGLLPPGTSVAVTFYPFDVNEPEDEERTPSVLAEASTAYSTRTPRRAGDMRGTLVIPSSDPDSDPKA